MENYVNTLQIIDSICFHRILDLICIICQDDCLHLRLYIFSFKIKCRNCSVQTKLYCWMFMNNHFPYFFHAKCRCKYIDTTGSIQLNCPYFILCNHQDWLTLKRIIINNNFINILASNDSIVLNDGQAILAKIKQCNQTDINIF